MKLLFGGPVRGHVQVEALSAYLDGQASPAERASIDAHLRECGACQAELDSLRRTVSLLQAMPRVPAPRAFTLSEAQVGVRRPDPAPGWFGGLARGFGAVAAVLVVALVAFAVLRPQQAPWSPANQIARVDEPTAALATAAQATEAPAPGLAAKEAPPVAHQNASEVAPTTETAQSEAAKQSPAPSPEPEQPSLAMAAAPPTEAADSAAAAFAAPEATATVEEPALFAAAATPEPEMGAAAATGRGGGGGGGMGGGGAGGPGIPAAQLTPEATPAGAPLADAMPSGIRFAYADTNTLWAVDRDGGARQLAQGRGINTPQLSPDQQWVAYRVYTDNGLQLWAVKFEGGTPKLLLDDTALPADRLPDGYVKRAFSDARWGPNNKTLTVNLVLVSASDRALPPITELWRVNVETGELKYLSELGRAWRPFYSPNGEEYLTVAYGADETPEGALTLRETEGGTATTVLTFPATPGKLAYDSQVAWTADGSSAWFALPLADNGQPNPPNGTEIYRVSGGAAEQVNRIDAFQVFWSPAADKMAYTRFAHDTLATNELYLADADGSNPQLYATLTEGQFISWSPSGARFLYQDNYQVFVGETGQAPVRLTNSVSMVNPRWISDDQIMSFHDTGDGWLLTLRSVDGDAVGLLPLPRETMWDVGPSR